MGKGLERANDDLRHGRARKARDRLKGLLASYPDDVEVRTLLAEAYRQDRQWPEAGRWGYLIGSAATDSERAAFEAHSAFGWYSRIKESRLRRLLKTDDLDSLADHDGRELLRNLPFKRNPKRSDGLFARIGRRLAIRRACRHVA